MTACDGCGQAAPEGHAHSFPRRGWVSIDSSDPFEHMDACSWECLATIVASRFAAGAE